jgi:hypothetical protein
MVREEVIAWSPSKLQLSPFLSKQQKVHPTRSLGFLHHPQSPQNNLGLTLHKRNYISKNENLLQDRYLEALLKKTKQKLTF